MSHQLFAEQTSEIVQRINPDVQLTVPDRIGVQVAPALRELSRNLRAKSEALRTKNRELMKRADAVALRATDLVSGRV